MTSIHLCSGLKGIREIWSTKSRERVFHKVRYQPVQSKKPTYSFQRIVQLSQILAEEKFDNSKVIQQAMASEFDSTKSSSEQSNESEEDFEIGN